MAAHGRRAALPTFVLLGAMKAGTTSFAAYLRSHPEIFFSAPKEPHYFTENHGRGLEWYQSLFAGAESAKASGEGSTSYTKSPQVTGAPERMAALVPDAKLLYLVRNPIERIRSHYVHRAGRFAESTIERDPIDVAVRRRPEYLDWTRYGHQLDQYLAHFPREQVLVVSSERLHDDRAATLAEVFGFLGVDPDVEVWGLDLERNTGASKRRRPARLDAAVRLARRTGVVQRLPKRRRASLQRLLQREEIDAAIAPDVEAWIWTELDDDLRRLRAIVGPDFDLWGRA